MTEKEQFDPPAEEDEKYASYLQVEDGEYVKDGEYSSSQIENNGYTALFKRKTHTMRFCEQVCGFLFLVVAGALICILCQRVFTFFNKLSSPGKTFTFILRT